MSAHEIDEDAVDLQDIQAQIDLSMSFAQNLVTTWVKPLHFAKANKQAELENELKEYMRRPARLGVGAPVPEMQSLAREAARLKSKLEGKKRQRGEEDVAEAAKIPSDDEGESRAGAIKKRARVDPFNISGKKKKKKNGTTVPAIHPVVLEAMAQDKPDTSTPDDLEANEVAEYLVKPSSSDALKKKKKKSVLGNSLEVDHPQREGSLPRTIELPKTPSSGNLIINPISPVPLSVHTVPTSPLSTRSNLVDVSLTLTPMLSPLRHSMKPEFLRQPLLNLEGPPQSPGESEDNEKMDPTESAKKKRKRRKKRKKGQDILPTTVAAIES